jgi:hypothetical protein
MQSSMLGIVKAGGIYRLFCFDDLRIDLEEMDIYGNNWGLAFEEFIENARSFNHEDHQEFLEFYPQSANQMMLESVWKDSLPLGINAMAELVKSFKPVQHGRIRKDNP